MSLYHLKKGLKFAGPVAIAIAVSSVVYTRSAWRGVLMALLVLAIGSVMHAWFESRAERTRRLSGILVAEPPIRVKATLEVEGEPGIVMSACKASLGVLEPRIGKMLKGDANTLVARLKHSWTCTGQIVALNVVEVEPGVVRIEVSSIPRYASVVVDLGVNYSNVYTIVEAIKHILRDRHFRTEEFVDLATGLPVR
jgi:hypothetical protein